MAVYTEVSDTQISQFLDAYDVGVLTKKTPIRKGVENTNYKIETTKDVFILTLFEKRVRESDLPFFMAYMKHLAGAGIPAATPVSDRKNITIHRLSQRPAALIKFLPGDEIASPEPAHCASLGALLARVHHASKDFRKTRKNPLAIEGWKSLADACVKNANGCDQNFADFISEELSVLEDLWPGGLKRGAVHTDLFPDNVFFQNGKITGLIDFYFSCTDAFAYDLAVCINAWCFDRAGNFQPDNARALMAAYRQGRELPENERAAFPILLRGAALRFLLTRLYDWLNPVKGAFVNMKDPAEYQKIISFHRNHYAPAQYEL